MQGKLLLFLSLLMITFHFTWIVLFVLPSSYVQYHGYIYFLPQSYTQEYSYLCKQHGFCCDKLNVALISFKGNRRPHTPHAGFVRFLFYFFIWQTETSKHEIPIEQGLFVFCSVKHLDVFFFWFLYDNCSREQLFMLFLRKLTTFWYSWLVMFATFVLSLFFVSFFFFVYREKL